LKTNEKHAFVVAGTQSGCGKTTISMALMAAFRARGLKVQPFKIGPDFIDPGLHTRVTALESRNLDGWMLSREYNLDLFQRLLSSADLAIVEGVMGLFDGYDGLSEAGSSAQMAKWLNLPIVLIVDARSMARSAAALVYGFKHFDSDIKLAGVIFNRIGGQGHLEYLKQAMSANLPDIPVLGGIPREDSIRIPERHLGLVTADELDLNQEWQQHLIGLVERNLELNRLWQEAGISSSSSLPSLEDSALQNESSCPLIIAVARDVAFCFYYPDNLELLRRAGARIEFFSPLAGETFPEGTAGLYLGGGYPELFAEPLSNQGRFFKDIRSAVERNMPVYAECGGLMALSKSIRTIEGKSYPMAGILPFDTRMLSKRKALGYTEVLLRQVCLLGQPGLRVRGHEFHYSEIVDSGKSPALNCVYELSRRNQAQAQREGYALGSVLASYIHLHWGSSLQVAENFVRHCKEYQSSKAQEAR